MSRTSRVVRLRPGPKDRTAAERMQRYRNRKKKPVTQAVTPEQEKAPTGRLLSSPVTEPIVTQAIAPAVTVERPPTDLIALRRDIAQWVANHHAVNRSQAVERRQRIKDRIAQLTFLALGVAFFVLLALAALNGQAHG